MHLMLHTWSQSKHPHSNMFQLVMMADTSQRTGAVCLDGSDYGFFTLPSMTQKTSWQIHLQGGGWCYTMKDCYARSLTALGSSRQWSRIQSVQASSVYFQAGLGAGGIMSTSCESNPAFCEFGKVVLPYCDGFSFSGNRQEPLVFLGKHMLYFRGRRILNAALQELSLRFWREAPHNVLLTGCSAGGLAVIMHADYIHEYLLAKNPLLSRFLVVPSSGFFPDTNSIEGHKRYASSMASAFKLAHASEGASVRCLSATQRLGLAGWQCALAEVAALYVEAPIFVIQSRVDVWSTSCILTAGDIRESRRDPCGTYYCAGYCSATANGTWAACADLWFANLDSCSSNQVERLNAFARDASKRITRALEFHKQAGLFLHSCLTHCAANYDTSWNSISIDGVTMEEAVSSFWHLFSFANSTIPFNYGRLISSELASSNQSCPSRVQRNHVERVWQDAATKEFDEWWSKDLTMQNSHTMWG